MQLKSFLVEVSHLELNLRNTFLNGQCFNWTQISNTHFAGVVYGCYLEVHRPDPQHIHVEHTPTPDPDFKTKFIGYLNLTTSLTKLHEQWSKDDEHMQNLAKKLPGTRILKQDPWECTISFICSSNNNISRITKLLQSLRQTYGTLICQKNGYRYHAFPRLEQLKDQIQASELRRLGFGYRAEFLVDAVASVASQGGQKYLQDLENKEYPFIKSQLVKLKGIGRKVADCICLFGMGCHQAVPIDTHIFQIAKRLGFCKQADCKKSMGDALYQSIAKAYVGRFGEYAGWAQQILFTGDLPQFNGKEQEQSLEDTEQDLRRQKQEPQATKRNKSTVTTRARK